jgi:hypothetical protein
MRVGGDAWLREHAQAYLNQATVVHGGRPFVGSVS